MEILDLYDENRKLTGKTIQRGEKVPQGCYRLVVHCAIFNSDGKMLIQRRHPNKPSWPNLWDISVGGCASHGESPYQAMVREIKEEIGLDLSFNPRPLFTFNFGEGFDDVYLIKADYKISDMHMQEDEVVELKYASKEEIRKMIENATFICYQPSYIDLLFETYEKQDLYIEIK